MEKMPNPQCVRLPSWPLSDNLYGIVIGPVIYMFGGGDMLNSLWKITQNTDGAFYWNIINMEDHKMPSPRRHYCGWEYGDKMWIFGGYGGKSPVGYLNDHGYFARTGGTSGLNNQLFSYNPSVHTWKNIECSGDVPSPRSCASAAAINDKVWLYGGYTFGGFKGELYVLDMNSLAWTHTHNFVPTSQGLTKSFLVPLTANKLVLHGRIYKDRFTWTVDVSKSYQWREYTADIKFDRKDFFTGTSGLNNDVVIIGGHNFGKKPAFSVNTVMLKPKSLQQLAMTIIHQNKKDLPWRSLLPPLICKRLT